MNQNLNCVKSKLKSKIFKKSVNHESGNKSSSDEMADYNNLVAKQPEKPKIIFQCQLAQGSPTGFLSGFASTKELYEKIADCYDIPVDLIMYCTLNSHKVDMNYLLTTQIGVNDLIFVHIKGQAKEVELLKEYVVMGITITDNSMGSVFIKKISKSSLIASKYPSIHVGDCIEKINEIVLKGKRHYEVAHILKAIPVGETVIIRLIEPIKSGFDKIGPRSTTNSMANGNLLEKNRTLRFRAHGVEVVNSEDIDKSKIDLINEQLDTYLGISDDELAQGILHFAEDFDTYDAFCKTISCSDFKEFGFSDIVLKAIWNIKK